MIFAISTVVESNVSRVLKLQTNNFIFTNYHFKKFLRSKIVSGHHNYWKFILFTKILFLYIIFNHILDVLNVFCWLQRPGKRLRSARICRWMTGACLRSGHAMAQCRGPVRSTSKRWARGRTCSARLATSLSNCWRWAWNCRRAQFWM